MESKACREVFLKEETRDWLRPETWMRRSFRIGSRMLGLQSTLIYVLLRRVLLSLIDGNLKFGFNKLSKKVISSSWRFFREKIGMFKKRP